MSTPSATSTRAWSAPSSGTDIPEIARIISVADAYDAMTSSRSYRAPILPQKVRDELAEGRETQFDPNFARIMLELIESGEAAP